MLGQKGPARGLRFAIFTLAATATFAAIASDTAEARYRRYYRHYSAPIQSSSNYAAIVIDANTGKELHAANADSAAPSGLAHQDHDALSAVRAARSRQAQARHTDEGVVARLPSGAHQARPATKARRSRVEDAIKALVTQIRQRRRRRDRRGDRRRRRDLRQDDDAQGARARHEPHRLSQRLRPARRRTGHHGARPGDARPRDPGPLPAATTSYFSTRSFTYQGQVMGNHNRLLGRVDGVDGIKTGYTRASGFNLVTSVRRGNRYLVAVVLGGASQACATRRMRQLVEQYVDRGATVRTAAEDRRGAARPGLATRWRRGRRCSRPQVQASLQPMVQARADAARRWWRARRSARRSRSSRRA